MTYNPAIPAINTRIDQTYSSITTNFSQLDVIFAKDHYEWDYATVADQGFHKQITLLQLPHNATAIPAAGALRGIIYTQQNAVGGVTRTDPYYFFNTGGIGAGAKAPLLPVKAFANFNGLGQLAANKYNVNTVTPIAGGYHVAFINKLNDAGAGSNFDYVVSLAYDNGVPRDISYRNLHNDGFDIIVSGSITTISFSVMTL